MGCPLHMQTDVYVFKFYECNNAVFVSALTFDSPGCSQIQIVSGSILRVEVCGRDPALLLRCADEPPT